MQYFAHLSRLFQTVGAGMCGFRTGTIPQKKTYMYSCIALTNVWSRKYNQHYAWTQLYNQSNLAVFQVHCATEEMLCTGGQTENINKK